MDLSLLGFALLWGYNYEYKQKGSNNSKCSYFIVLCLLWLQISKLQVFSF